MESTPENLKNVLLVMNASGVLLPEQKEDENAADTRTPVQKQFFLQTFERIQPFLPHLQNELFPKPSA